MAAKLLVSRVRSKFYREDRLEGLTHYDLGQIIKGGPVDMLIGRFWVSGPQGRVIVLDGATEAEARMWAGEERADIIDIGEFGLVLGDEAPPLLRKRMYRVDIVGLEAAVGPLSDGDAIRLNRGQTKEFTDRLEQLPKTRWTKVDWNASRSRRHEPLRAVGRR